jgi:tartrate/fumarate subfamily iron-sulfur-dependent hydro-lyase alpha chain
LPALGTSLLELIRRTAHDLPADVDQALVTALKGEEPGTNGEAAMELCHRAAVHARKEKIPLGGEPAVLRFTVDAPPAYDRAAFRAAADEAAHLAAEEGVVRTDFVDLPGGRPRRGMQLGAPPTVIFRDLAAPAGGDGTVRVTLRIVSEFEVGSMAIRTLPGPGTSGLPSLDGVVAMVLAAIHEMQGRPAGPGVIGIHVGADPVNGLALAEAELLRPIDDRNPQRPLAQLESRVVERVNQLGIGPLALGGRTTILGAKIAMDPAPAERWAVSIAVSSWALRRHTVEIGADGAIRAWESALTPEAAAKSEATLAARAAQRRTAEKAAEKAAKAAAAARAAAKPAPRPHSASSAERNAPRGILGGVPGAPRKSAGARATSGGARPLVPMGSAPAPAPAPPTAPPPPKAAAAAKGPAKEPAKKPAKSAPPVAGNAAKAAVPSKAPAAPPSPAQKAAPRAAPKAAAKAAATSAAKQPVKSVPQKGAAKPAAKPPTKPAAKKSPPKPKKRS